MEGGSSSSSISKKVDFSILCNQQKSAIWLFWSKEDGGYFTGFGVHESGLVMSIAHGWVHLTQKEFMARRMDQERFHKVTLEYCNESYDVSLFRIQNLKKNDFPVVQLANDGSLNEGCPVFTIGHPACFTGSISSGFVSYPCIDDVDLPVDGEECINYVLESLNQSPSHRVYGHVWHKAYFKEVVKAIAKIEDSALQQSHSRLFTSHSQLNPRVPIVQCSGITSFPGASGSPLFNMRGEVVGIIVAGPFAFQIAVHVSLLRHVLDDYLAKHKAISPKSTMKRTQKKKNV